MTEPDAPQAHPFDDPRPPSRWVHMGACKYCGSDKPMLIFWRLKLVGEIRENARGSQEFDATWWPWARCDNCFHESEGQITHNHDDDLD